MPQDQWPRFETNSNQGLSRLPPSAERYRLLTQLLAQRAAQRTGPEMSVQGLPAFRGPRLPREAPQAAGQRKPTPNTEWRDRGRWKPDVLDQRSENAMHIFDLLIRDGMPPAQAAAWAANAEAESGSGQRMSQGVPGGGEGAFQWDARRRANFPRAVGRTYEQSTLRDQLAFPRWELENDPYERRRSAPAIRKAITTDDAGVIADAISRHYLRPREEERDAADRANLANAILRRWRSRGPHIWRSVGPDRR